MTLFYKLSRIFVICAFFILIAAPSVLAEEQVPQPFVLQDAQVQKFQSNIVKADYQLYISLPRNYDKETQAYPVIFVLDADYCFPIVHQLVRFLSDHDEINPAIVVGIAYPGVAQEKFGPLHKLNRTRDYTPSHVAKGGYGDEFQRQSGGADQFLLLLEKELIPNIESKFRVKHDRTIVGYSFGGLFASYAMVKKPALFQRYIVVSPSLWYDRRFIFRIERQLAQSRKDIRATAFLSVGSFEHGPGREEMVKDLTDFAKTLQSRNYPNLHIRFLIEAGEDHHSIFPGAAMSGLRYVFSKSRKF